MADLKVEGQSADNRRENTTASAEGGDMTDRIDQLLKALTTAGSRTSPLPAP